MPSCLGKQIPLSENKIKLFSSPYCCLKLLPTLYFPFPVMQDVKCLCIFRHSLFLKLSFSIQQFNSEREQYISYKLFVVPHASFSQGIQCFHRLLEVTQDWLAPIASLIVIHKFPASRKHEVQIGWGYDNKE